MSSVRSFLFSHDPSVDLGILSTPAAVARASILSGERVMLPSNTAVHMTAIRIPFINVGFFSVGVICGRVGVRAEPRAAAAGIAPPELLNPAASFSNMATRHMSLGRYCRDERTGEILHVVSDVRRVHSSTVSAIWYDGIRGSGAPGLQERMDILCDSALFATGRVVDSVIRCERSVKERLVHVLPPVLPEGPADFSHQVGNMACHSGRSRDFSLKPSDGFVDGRLLPVRMGSITGAPVFEEEMLPCNELSPLTAHLRMQLMESATQFIMARETPILGMCIVVDLYRTALSICRERVLSGGTEALAVLLAEPAVESDVGSPSSVVVGFMPNVISSCTFENPSVLHLGDVDHDDRPNVFVNCQGEGASLRDGSTGRTAHISPFDVPMQANNAAAASSSTMAAASFSVNDLPLNAGGGDLVASARPPKLNGRDWQNQQKLVSRRAQNIAAAKRSNAKRKLARENLERNLGLLKSLEDVLSKRRDALAAENKELREKVRRLAI